MPIPDYVAAAETIAGFLKLVTAAGHFKLRYRITAGPGAADPDGFEAREIYVEFSGPDAPLLTERNGELLRALEHVAAKMLRLESEEHDLVSFDADQFKAERARELKRRAAFAVEQVEATDAPYTFPSMNSRERRLLHLALKPYVQIESASVGEGADRTLVAFPRGYDQAAFARTFTPPPTNRPRPSFAQGRGPRR